MTGKIDFLYRKTRSVFYLLLNIVVYIFYLPFIRYSNLKISKDFSRDQIINYLLKKDKLKNPIYLEIGCDLNQTFSKVNSKDKIGIDPVRGGNIRLNSERYFNTYSENMHDVIFIDGSHLIEEVYFDTIKSLTSLNLGGYILLDDVLPNNSINSFRKRCTLHSYQDAFKILFFLNTLDFIELYLLPYDHGMALVKLINDVNIDKLDFNFKNISFSSYVSLLPELNHINLTQIEDLDNL
ncbi:class I SAM-dependent methyltransferase [Acidimicrobiaceae bacterium]|jgi:hypothetical protein|nr:class I SAM-dependent methyltransferase [Acidimicrobiaceae bacterium]|tara:strand:+ start:169 stop:882 length:714 start_codon:yes stop_codon:yes gene_type:complete